MFLVKHFPNFLMNRINRKLKTISRKNPTIIYKISETNSSFHVK